MKMPKKTEKKADTAVIPYGIEIKLTNILSAVSVLRCTEHQLVFQGLRIIDSFIAENEETNLKVLLDYDLINILFDVINNQNHKTITQRMIAKIILKYVSSKDFIYLRSKISSRLDNLLNLFTGKAERVLQEQLVDIMYELREERVFLEHFCEVKIIYKFYYLFINSQEIDFIKKSVEILKNMICLESLKFKLDFLQEFHIGILFALRTYNGLKSLILTIFDTLSQTNLRNVHDSIIKVQVLETFFEELMVVKWENIEYKYVQIINNCIFIGCYDYRAHVITCPEFMNLLEYTACHSDVYSAYFCIILLYECLKIYTNIQDLTSEMAEMKFIELLPNFFRFKSAHINLKICEIITHLCNCSYLFDGSIISLYLKPFRKMIMTKKMPWIPYRQAPLYPLYSFLMENTSLTTLYKKFDLYTCFLEVMKQRSELTNEKFTYLIKIYAVLLLSSKDCHLLLVPRDIFIFLFKCFMLYFQYNATYTTHEKYLKIMAAIIETDRLRHLFMEFDGHKRITQLLNYYNSSININLLYFLRRFSHYPEIVTELLRTQITAPLRRIATGVTNETRAICNEIINELLARDLTIKFYETNNLNENDIISYNFMTYAGPKPSYFPYNDISIADKLSVHYTMIVVNIKSKKKYDQGTDSIKHVPCRDDLVLNDYVTMIKKIFEHEQLVELDPAKIKRLAVFICDLYSVNDPQAHNNTIMERNRLKKFLRSNILPLGCLKYGGLIERAVLFKVLADRVGIPCTLKRSAEYEGIAWNEVPLDSQFFDEIPECNKQGSKSCSAASSTGSNELLNLDELDSYSIRCSGDQQIPIREGTIIKSSTLFKNLRPSMDVTSVANSNQFTSLTAYSSKPLTIPDPYFQENRYYYRKYIVDLRENFGALYRVNSKEGTLYCTHATQLKELHKFTLNPNLIQNIF